MKLRLFRLISPLVLLAFACQNQLSHKLPAPGQDSAKAALPSLATTWLPGQQAKGVILITIDTLRADHVGAYGNRSMVTHQLDLWGKQGALFRRAFANSTTTSPSHVSLMTSSYPQDHGVYSNFEAVGDEPITLAEKFEQAGFATFAIVNMRHLNPDVVNLGQGFQTFVKSGNMRRADATLQITKDWLRQLPEHKKFFAWVHLADVHTPYHPPSPYDRLYYPNDEHSRENNSLASIWPTLPSHLSDHPFFRSWLAGITDLQWILAQYKGAVTYVDDVLGAFWQDPQLAHILPHTALALTSDHGESLGEHGMYFVHTGLYEVTLKVPLLIRLPAMQSQTSVIHDVVELVDLYPTLLDYMAIPIQHPIRGQSLLPLMQGKIQPEKVAYGEHAGKNQIALRSQHHKYIRHLRTNHLQPTYPFVAGKEELYDLRDDPFEKQDLAQQRPELIRLYRNLWQQTSKQPFRYATGKATLDTDTVELLRSLGYIR